MKFLRAASAVFLLSLVVIALHASTGVSLQMQLGNPTSAATDPNNHTHYLIQRSQYTLDYNDTTRNPNWVAWDLTALDHGSVSRSDFNPDPDLPSSFYAVTTDDYNGVGNINFNRGHMCPSADRNDTTANNVPVFYMTNIVPQSADNNQGPWELFESECRNLASAGNELLIISGPSFFGTAKVPSGVADIPNYVWKIAVVVPSGAGTAASRITANTRVIALKMPNINGIRSNPWTDYVVSASEIEADTGYQFFTTLDPNIAAALRMKVDSVGTGGGAPTITTQPASQTVLAGSSVTFSVAASGSSLSYEWRKDGDVINGATNPTYTVNGVQSTDAGGYDVVVSNSSGAVTSNLATLTLATPTAPAIVTQPGDQTASAGGSATFTVVATGVPAPTYQWYRDTTFVSGATGATLSLSGVQSTDSGSSFTVVVTNSVGSVTSNPATLTVVSTPPAITTQPISKNVTTGSNVTFTVAASGTPPLTYQWRKNGTLVSGATSTALSLAAVQAVDGGSYDVVVSNAAGSATSNLAVLNVGVAAIYWDFATASPTSGVPSDITVSALSQGNNNGTTTLITSSSVSSGYTGASGGNNAGAAARKTATLDTSATGSAYFQFTLTPGAADKRVTVSSLSFGSRSTTTGPINYTILTNADNYATPVATGAFNGTTGNDSVWRLISPSLAAVTGAPGAAVTIRIYGWGANTTSNPSAGTANWRIDDLNVLASTGSASTVAVAATSPAANAASVSVSSGLSITFNQPVSTNGAWFTIASAANGAVAATASGGPTTFTLTPGASFAYNDSVTVTLAAAQIADQATGTVHPTSNYSYTFATAAPVAPAISTQPVSQAVIVGGSVSFSVTATGTAPLTYQWKKNGTPIPGATNSALNIGTAASADAGSYTVVVNNVTNIPVTSSAAVLTVSATPIAPGIVTQPQPQTIALGGTATFSVAASGTTPLTYQWRKDGVNLANGSGVSGANSATLTLNGVTFLSAGAYSVVVSNTASPSAVSNSVTLNVTTAAGASVVYFNGGTYGQNFNALPASGSFSFAANGPYALDAAVANGGVNAIGMSGWSFAKYAGSGSNAVFGVGSGSDTAGSANSYGSSGSVDRSLGSLASGSVVSRFGVMIVNTSGQTITQFTVGYAGEQWRKGGSNVANTLAVAYSVGATDINTGAFVDVAALNFTSPVVTTTSGALDGNGYANRTIIGGQVTGLNWAPGQVLVLRWSDANDSGADDGLAIDDLTFSTATPVVPTITTQPIAQTASVGGNVTFTVAATGNPAVTYQWRKGGVPLAGATAATLSLSNVSTSSAGDYDVVVTNGIAPAATSSIAPLTVNKLPATVALSNLSASYDGTAKAATATTSPAGLPVTLTYNGNSTAPTNAGSYAVVATISSATYEGSATGTLVISPAVPSITWPAPAAIIYGTALSSVQLNATASVSGGFVYTPSAGAVLPAGNQTLNVAFTPTDANNYTTATASTTLTVTKAVPVITWPAPAAITYGTALGAAQLNATANTAGSFAYTPPAGTVLGAGSNQPLSVLFTPLDANNYTSATAATTISVDKAAAAIALSNLVHAYDGTPKTVTATTTPANLHVDITYNDSVTPPTNPGSYAVVATINEANYTGSATGALVISAAVLVNHAPAINGGVGGSIQVMLGEDIALNGSAWVSGDLLVGGLPEVQLNGQPTFGSTIDGMGDLVPANYTVTLSGSAVLGHVVRRTNAINLPAVAVPPMPSGTRSVVLNNANQNAGDFSTVRDLTLNGNAGAVAVRAGTYGNFTANGNSSFVLGQAGAETAAVYNLQSLALNGASRIQIVGPAIINLASGSAITGTVGSPEHPEWLTLNVASGDLSVNGGVTIHGSIVAPTAAIVVNGTVHGTTASDQLVIGGSGMVAQP